MPSTGCSIPRSASPPIPCSPLQPVRTARRSSPYETGHSYPCRHRCPYGPGGDSAIRQPRYGNGEPSRTGTGQFRALRLVSGVRQVRGRLPARCRMPEAVRRFSGRCRVPETVRAEQAVRPAAVMRPAALLPAETVRCRRLRGGRALPETAITPGRDAVLLLRFPR
jgi:hypothetical protein